MSEIELLAENELTPIETEERAFHERVIHDAERGKQKLTEIQLASLKALFDQKLYRSTHKTFPEYCKATFDFEKAYSYFQIGFAQVKENLSTLVDFLPATERQARPLTKLPNPELQAQAWTQAQADSGKDQPSNREVAEAVAKVQAELESERAARELFERRAQESQAESNERRLKIRELETQVDLLKAAEPEVRVVEKPVVPADYETTKAQAEKLKTDIADLKKKQADLVQQQVAAKLREREREIATLDRQAKEAEALLASLNQQIDRYTSIERMTRLQRDLIEKTRSALVDLASHLESLTPLDNDPDTDRLWDALAAMLRNGAAAVEYFRGNAKPALTVIRGSA